MRISNDFRLILKPTLLCVAIFVSLSLMFVASYVFIEHQKYLSAYQITQQQELKALQQKTTIALENLKKLSQLTSERIAASQGDVKRIQNILSSVPRLNPSGTIPKLQKVFYSKFSSPQMVITLFGPFPLYSQTAPEVRTPEKETSITFDENAIICRTPVFNEIGNLEGTLEIQIDPSDFSSFLGSTKTETVNLSQVLKNEEGELLQKAPFPIYARQPNDLVNFIYVNQTLYAFFYYFTVIGIIFIACCAYYLNFRIKKSHKIRLEELEALLLKATTEENHLKGKLLTKQQHYKSSLIAFETYIKHLTILKKRYKEQAAYLSRSLNVVEQSLKNPKSSLSEETRAEIIDSCLKVCQSLSSGLISKTQSVPLDLRALLEEIRSLFSEKIYKSQLTLDLACISDLNFQGDPLFTKFILINVIGKSIHSLSKNGKSSIFMRENTRGFELEIQDNGYSLADTTEGLMERYPDLFVKEEVFQRLCQDNGLEYEASRVESGLNAIKIVFPTPLDQTSSHNVIPLFPS